MLLQSLDIVILNYTDDESLSQKRRGSKPLYKDLSQLKVQKPFKKFSNLNREFRTPEALTTLGI